VLCSPEDDWLGGGRPYSVTSSYISHKAAGDPPTQR
jgi:hypothetical protein